MNKYTGILRIAAIRHQQAHQTAEDARELCLWLSMTDEDRDGTRKLPWMDAHVAKMDSMADAMMSETGAEPYANPIHG